MRATPVQQRQRIHVLQAGALMTLPLLFLAQPTWDGAAHEFIEIAGIILVFACMVGRMWSILYVGSKKNTELVTTGPFSMMRNPLYFFSCIGAVGVGLMYGSLLVALGLGAIAYAVFSVTAAKEAEFLLNKFGPAYEAYSRRTPRFWPSPALYSDEHEVYFSPKALRRTVLDAMLFLAVFPVIELLEYLHVNGTLPILMRVL